MRRSVAFTLVELIVVIALIAILTAAVMSPLAGSWGTANLRESARGVLLAAQYARGYAATRQVRCRLAFDVKDNRYVIEQEADPHGQPGRFTPVQADLTRPRSLGKGVKFGRLRIEPRDAEPAGATPQAVTFEPTGQANAAVIEITGDTGTWSVRIAPNTGRADLVEGADVPPPFTRVDLDA